jgi:hypothetical protein
MTTVEQLRRQLLSQEFAERLGGPAQYDTSTDTLAPASWFLTICATTRESVSLAVIEIVEELTHQQLAGVFADAAAEHGGDHGHARCIDGEVIFFGTDAEALADYANDYMALQRQQEKRSKGFG